MASARRISAFVANCCRECAERADALIKERRGYEALHLINRCARVDVALRNQYTFACPLLGSDVLVVDDWWFGRSGGRIEFHPRTGDVVTIVVRERYCKLWPTARIATDDSFIDLEIAEPLVMPKYGPRRPVVDSAGRLVEVRR